MKHGKLALADVPRALRDAVVTESRARWKTHHDAPTEREIRLLRFIWMREIYLEDRYKLHAGTLGALMRKRLVYFATSRLLLTPEGCEALDIDRRRRP